VNAQDCGEAELDVEYIMGVAQNSPTWFWSIGDDDQYPFLYVPTPPPLCVLRIALSDRCCGLCCGCALAVTG
jgi:hypothetical protein